MWFVLRAIFWLTIVYGSIFWPNDKSGPFHAFARVAHAAKMALGHGTGTAEAEVAKVCARAPQACLEGAARLGRMAGQERTERNRKALARPGSVESPAVAN